MLAQLRSEAAVSARALRSVAANPALRRLELAWLGSTLGDFAYVVGLAVYAYRASGASAVALLVVARMLPAAAVAPFAAGLADRLPRRTVMLASDAARAAV